MNHAVAFEDQNPQENSVNTSWPMERQMLCRTLNEGLSQNRVAELTGINRSYISRYANGKLEPQYVPPVEEALRRYFQAADKWSGSEPEKPTPINSYMKQISELGTIMTNDYYRAKGACQAAYEGDFSMVVGDPGTGKTRTLKEFSRNNNNVFLVTCSRNTRNKALLKKIAEAIKTEVYGTSGDLEARIIKKLLSMHENAVLILDEADFLSLDCLETIRAIYDQVNDLDRDTTAKLGIVLSGNQRLEEMVLIYADENPDYKRIRDRVGVNKKLTGLGELEAEKFIKRLNCTKGARDLLIRVGVKRGARQLVMALKRLLDVTNGEKTITEGMVEELGDIVLSFKS